ncbi:MAG: hypothetical protein P8Q90_05705 [Candidatus Thalassarchaeaceae archaeon]|nr:hypothetical protein [Candidatus Thalassarchaeaceae archaeon]
MSSESYAESLEGVLKAARNAQPATKNEEGVSNSRENMLRAAALVAVLSCIDTTDERASTGRQMGSAWSQDHRRSAMGQTRLMESRKKRSSWR